MQKGTITVLGHKIECENETGDTIDGDKLSVAIKEGKKTGILYRPGTGAEIGTWKIVNPWKEMAEQLYRITKLQTNRNNILTDERVKVANEIMQQYEQLCKEQQ